jgi:hypothetical protein
VAGTTTAEELEHTLVFVCVGVDLYALQELSWSFMERLFCSKTGCKYTPTPNWIIAMIYCFGLLVLAFSSWQ